MQSVVSSIYDPVSHRHAVEGEFKRQLLGLLYNVYVRPRDCAVCRMVGGCVYLSPFWNNPIKKETFFIGSVQFPNIPYI